MAFNFNWSPLIADTSRARDMLTTALNKSPKPPIIVDDIIVNELNLGSVPPELEILEVGDLAEDRFRGIFKMSYTGDAYLTLKTRVQANPLNTYLSTKPDFASPRPLAADSGLTIPIQITLSDFRLSGFVILVFSRQKGITLVFRNDPLESLKVSSTFDSIPFVRNYLQKEIEKQLRVLFMDDLPAIIHRLSLRYFVPEYKTAEEEEEKRKTAEKDSLPPVDPLASPPQNPSDMSFEGLDDRDASLFSLDSPNEVYASFSQKNLLRLAALSESQRTLSLFTPSMRDTVFRAWASAKEGAESSGSATPYNRAQLLARLNSGTGSGTGTSTPSMWSSTASETSDAPTHTSRPSISSCTSSATVYTMGTSRSRAHANKKRRHRVVNLRKTADKDIDDSDSVSTDFTGSNDAPSITITEPPHTPLSETPELQRNVRFHSRKDEISTPEKQSPRTPTPKAEEKPVPPFDGSDLDRTPRAQKSSEAHRLQRPKLAPTQTFSREKASTDPPRSASTVRIQSLIEGSSGGILEQAWMMKMATEIARKVHEEKAAGGFWEHTEGMDHPPPAYGV